MTSAWHIRRCHVCGDVTENTTEPVYQCSHCGKHFSPFFYFDEKLSPINADFTLRPLPLPGQFWPVQGLSAYWDLNLDSETG